MLYVAILYVSIRPVVMRVKEEFVGLRTYCKMIHGPYNIKPANTY